MVLFPQKKCVTRSAVVVSMDRIRQAILRRACEQEAAARNAHLRRNHGEDLPSYVWWCADTVGRPDSWGEWWEGEHVVREPRYNAATTD